MMIDTMTETQDRGASSTCRIMCFVVVIVLSPLVCVYDNM